jgi:hypothetical protein
MKRLFLFALVLCAGQSLAAQEIFVAPTARTVVALTEQGIGEDLAQTMLVTNYSTVPIIVFGVVLTACENVKQPCGSRRTNIRVHPKQRVTIGRVQPRDTERGFSYRWAFSYHPDSADEKAIAALREHGIELAGATGPRPPGDQETTEPLPSPSAMLGQTRAPNPEPSSMTSLSPQIEPPPSRPTTTLRFKVGYGSILGSTMMPGKPVQATGSCVNPAETAKLERDPKITKAPWRPAVLEPDAGTTRLPDELRDSVMKSNDVLVRFATDTAGAAIPESISVLESPYGLLSVRVCTTMFSVGARPAKDREGRAVASWIQTPVKVYRY